MADKAESLKKIQSEWYARLKGEGFIDIEDTERQDAPLKTWHSLKWQNVTRETWDAVSSYFDQAKALLDTYQFDTPMHKRIWELHCQGLSRRKIEKALSNDPNAYKGANIGLIIQSIAQTIK